MGSRHAANVITAIGLLVLANACGGSRAVERHDDALVIVLPTDVLQLDPRRVTDAYGLKLSRLLFGSLVTIDPHTLQVVPDLAERVEVVSPLLYRVTLRDGLRFSDGSALDAADVISTYRSVLDPGTASPFTRNYSRIAHMTAPNSRTVEFHLREPHATFLTDLELPIVRAEDARAVIALKNGPRPVSSGPYTLERRTVGNISLVANPHWYGGAPLHAHLRFVVVRDDNTRALRLLAGAGDVALNAVPPLLVPLFEHNARFHVTSAVGVGTTYLGFNVESSKVRDPLVRQAIAYAIDRNAIIEAKFHGRAQSARGFVPPGHWAYEEALPSYTRNLARARALLDSAGLRDPDGEGPLMRVQLVLRTSSDRFRQSIARAIAAQLAEVGIDVDVRPSELATLIADLNAGRFEMSTLQIPEVFEPHALSWFFASDRIPGSAGHEGANRWRYRNPSFDDLLERGRATTDIPARRAIYSAAQQILARDLPALPLWHEDVVAITNARAAPFSAPRDGRFGTLARR
ncbi:MAG: ABC transporter substrate-binding protein [Sandaracinaceae bacterium]|nr:ABC transporter substrate-binding protein [Sandaracinaceae bacterium]